MLYLILGDIEIFS